MTIMRAVMVRTRGTWASVGGSAIVTLADSDDATGVRLDPTAVDDGAVMRLGDGGYMVVGDWDLRLRMRRSGGPMTIRMGISIGDPGDGAQLSMVGEEREVPASTQLFQKVIASGEQRFMRDPVDVWFSVRVIAASGDSQLFITELGLDVPDDPVGVWNSDLSAAPDDTLVWGQFTDGRARQCKRVSGEWYNAVNEPIENALPHPESFMVTYQSIQAWGVI